MRKLQAPTSKLQRNFKRQAPTCEPVFRSVVGWEPKIAKGVLPLQLGEGEPFAVALEMCASGFPGLDSVGRNPVGVGSCFDSVTQGSSCLATLGFGPESRWDSRIGRQETAPAMYVTS